VRKRFAFVAGNDEGGDVDDQDSEFIGQMRSVPVVQ